MDDLLQSANKDQQNLTPRLKMTPGNRLTVKSKIYKIQDRVATILKFTSVVITPLLLHLFTENMTQRLKMTSQE